MKRLILIFLLLPILVCAEWDKIFGEEEDPMLFHHVNVITGNLNLCFQDTVVQGAKSLPIMRTYTSAGALERTPDNLDLILEAMRGWIIQGGWNFFPHANLLIESAGKKEDFKVYLAERSGNILSYSVTEVVDSHTIILKPDKKIAQSSGNLSARTNPQNNVLEINLKRGEATLRLPDGGKRLYTGVSLHHYRPEGLHKDYYILQKETLPSKHKITYTYGEKRSLEKIAITNPSESKTYASISLEGSPFYFHVKTSDKKAFSYRAEEHKGRVYLSEVNSNCRSHEKSSYDVERDGIGARMLSLNLGGKQQFRAHYNLPPSKREDERWRKHPDKKEFSADKVRSLDAPVGPNGEDVQIARFTYHEDYTDARDVENCLTRYHHNSENLSKIEYFDNNDKLSSSLKFIWKDHKLRSKVYFDQNKQPLFAKIFHYDPAGNVRKEILSGNLTGTAIHSFSLDSKGKLENAETYCKTYTYSPDFNLVLTEVEEDGLTYKYSYKSNTDLPKAKFTCDKDRILVREFFIYNDDHLLTCEMIDDGTSEDPNDLTHVTQRRIKRYDLDPKSGLSKTLTENYLDLNTHREVLLKKIQYTYNKQKLVETEEIFDANGTQRYSLLTYYDFQGRIYYKTNPLGQASTYSYNELGNLKTSHEPGSTKKVYNYDLAGRPASCEETDNTGKVKTTHTVYDAKGRLLSQTDAKGNTTLQKYDTFGRCLRTKFPKIVDDQGTAYSPKIIFTYDAQGNLATTTTPKNETTQTFYNTYRKPIRVIQADGTELRYIYNKNGTLAKTIYPDQTQIHYTYDVLQRTTSKRIYSSHNELLSQESWKYNSFQLLSYTDPHGLATTYTYDGAGRKISEQALDRIKTFAYDALGFLERTTEANVSHIQLHDVAGRVIQEWDEDPFCKENNTVYSYNDQNRKAKALRTTSQGEATDLFFYDGEGRLIRHTDPNGSNTLIDYNDAFFNDLGQRVLQKTTTDPLGNATLETYDALSHLVELEKKTPSGITISHDQFFYDRAGNKSERLSIIYLEDKPTKEISTTWTYDALGRVTKEIEAGQKTTLYEYDRRGRIFKKTLPSGTILTSSYDGIDRLLDLESSDGSIHYQYTYLLGPNPTQILDLVQNTKLERTYNLFGQLIQETSHLTYQWDFDNSGRCTRFTLPDRSSIAYSYTGLHLNTVARHSSSGQLLYEHNYTHFDPNGRIVQEELISNLGTLKTTRDLLERPISQESSWLQIAQTYGPSSLVTQTNNSLFGEKKYSYDALNQLLQEGDQEYLFDSFGNPSDCETNDCNQILSTPDCELTYDANGNPIKRLASEFITYTYDALGRLTSINYPTKQVHYTYDAFSRLVSKDSDSTVFYLYDHDKEIGTLSNGEIQELKVLGLGIQGDIGAAIALEIRSQVYAPLHDFNGNIVALIASNGQLIESYKIDAFGKEKTSSSLNPWRFCSKRSEEGLVFFGKRFYDPALGRWLTPDPSGFADGPNLYVYVLNSPLNRLDLFGLFSNENFPADIRIDVPIIQLRELPGIYNKIFCQGLSNGVSVDFIVACGHWHKIQFTPEEMMIGKVNIVDHFHELMPKDGAIFGLVTATNGIWTNLEDFGNMCQSIIDMFPERPLFIGMHNRTEGKFADLYRAHQERKGKDTPIVIQARQFLGAIIDTMPNLNPPIYLLSINHSEGGAIQKLAIEGLTKDQKEKLQKQLFLFSVAPASPIPRKYGMEAINIYSEKDKITKWCCNKVLGNPTYDIRILQSESSDGTLKKCISEHYFSGVTYQKAINAQIEDLRINYGFFNAQNR